MNLILYVMMVVTGGLGCVCEMLYGRTNRLLLLLTGLLFVLTACSRIENAYDYSDLVHYIDFFMADNDAYFEPGYVFLTDTIKWIVGYRPVVLIVFISVWVFLIALYAEKICSHYLNRENDTEIVCFPSTFLLLHSLQ